MAIRTPTSSFDFDLFEPCSAEWNFSGINEGITVSMWLKILFIDIDNTPLYFYLLDSGERRVNPMPDSDYRLFELGSRGTSGNFPKVIFKGYKVSWSGNYLSSKWRHYIYSIGKRGARQIRTCFINGRAYTVRAASTAFKTGVSDFPVLRLFGNSPFFNQRLAQLAIWNVADLEVTAANIGSFYSATSGMVDFPADGTVLGKRPLYYFTDNLIDNKGSLAGWPKNSNCGLVEYPEPEGLVVIKRAT